MGRVKEQLLDQELASEIFGFLDGYILRTDEEELNVGDTVTIINTYCNRSYDNVKGVFEDNLYYFFIVDLELIEMKYIDFEKMKSDEKDYFAFAECRVKKVHKKSY